MKFCSQCGGELVRQIPPGDDRERLVCPGCTTIHYQNPRIITGCLPTYDHRVLLCRRNIEPRRGYWTLPAGFLESGEALVEGAMRESFEEARANLRIDGLYGIYDVVHISQICMVYRATLLDLHFHPGPESQETRLFDQGNIPWQALAFPVIDLVLRRYFNDRQNNQFPLHNVILTTDAVKQPGHR